LLTKLFLLKKAFYISSIVLIFIFLFVCGYYIAEVDSARSEELFSSINSYANPYNYGYSNFNMYAGFAESYTREAALVSIFFFLVFIITDIFGLVRVKTKTVKVLGIIGICLSGIMLIWDFLI